jgi:hypothetical protein
LFSIPWLCEDETGGGGDEAGCDTGAELAGCDTEAELDEPLFQDEGLPALGLKPRAFSSLWPSEGETGGGGDGAGRTTEAEPDELR